MRREEVLAVMASRSGNPWKAATFALAGVMGGALATAAVLGYGGLSAEAPAPTTPVPLAQPAPALAGGATLETFADDAAQPSPIAASQATTPAATQAPPPTSARRAPRSESAAPVQRASVQPAVADIETCNRYASSTRDKARNALEKAVVGGLVGAAVGAAGGAIADGGDGAGKGAGIGGIVGAAAGTAYGINQTNQSDARAEAAYRDCMQRRGYSSYARY